MRAVIAIVVLVGAYAAACWWSPFGRCLLCGGARMRRTRILRRLVDCRWCDGSGRRLRLGRRAYNYLADIAGGAR